MKKLIFTLILIIIALLSQAQNVAFQWAKRMGLNSGDFGNSIALDAAGNVYSTGYFYGTVDFDPGPGVFNLISNGMCDIYISKIDAAGNFVWAKKMGGLYSDYGSYLALDGYGSVYIAGIFLGTADFDPSAAVFNLTSAGAYDIFISKLDTLGNFIWADRMGGSGPDYGKSIAFDSKGQINITGEFYNTADFDPGPAVFSLTSAGDYDAFIAKLDPGGNFMWAKDVGGVFEDRGNSIATDVSGNVYVTGNFQGTSDFDPGPGVFTLASAGGDDIFVLKLDAAGNFLWAKNMGGTNFDFPWSIKADASGNIFTSGYYAGIADFDPGAGIYNLSSAGGSSDIFVSKLDPSGNFIWAKSMGGFYDDVCFALTLDNAGNVYTTGYFLGNADFDPGAGISSLSSAGDYDIFVSKLNASGNFVWAEKMGGTGIDKGNSIALDALLNVYTTGGFYVTADFDPGPGFYNLTSSGINDIFIHKMAQTAATINGIEAIADEDKIVKVYPNPANGLLNIELSQKLSEEDLKVRIVNAIGEEILTIKSDRDKIQLDTKDLPKGIYFLNLTSNANTVSTKFVIEK